MKMPYIFHNWTKWEVSETGETRRMRDNASTGRYEVQRRVCDTCGKSQMRIVRLKVV